jgi:AGAP003322-PA
MSRLYDVIIFGASGFTAGYIIEELIRYTGKSGYNLKWALAGRNVSKIKDTLKTAMDYAKTANFNSDNVKIIEADVTNIDSLNNMTRLCQVLVNCVGPYNTLGEAVIKSCLG